MNVLESIMAERRAAVAAARAAASGADLEARARGRVRHSLRAALAAPTLGSCIIAEVKKASPSAGLLRRAYDPAATAALYAAHGACGVSVLTEPLHFLGSEEDLVAVRRAIDLPVLRKDFLCDPYQVLEAAAWGADLVLLIVAALEDSELRALHAAAVELGLEVLVETHTEAEVERALALGEIILGVNSRDLKTLRTDLAVAERLARMLPLGVPAVAESGIRTPDDIRRLRAAGYRGFLIGEVLMRQPDPGALLREMVGVTG
jgi:indole-3-glycerol phosphate synthase